MSTPPFVELPQRVIRTSLATARGEFAALRADPPPDATAYAGTRNQVLLVPGYSGSKEDFIALLEPIAAAGHPVVAIDQRGQLDTPGPAAEDAYTTAALGADVRAMLDVLTETGPVHLFGHSFGGLVTRAALLSDPSGVLSYTLLGSGPGGIVGARQRHARLLVSVVARFGTQAVGRAMQQFEVLRPSPKPAPEVAAFMHDRYARSSPHALVAMARAVLSEPDRADELALFRLPMLVVHGEDDDAWPPHMQEEMAKRLDAQYEVLADAGHSPNVDVPEQLVKTLLHFWDGVEREGPR
ncbi:MAG: alpha/beta fold hydrolase [Streptosporangiales bacterium]